MITDLEDYMKHLQQKFVEIASHTTTILIVLQEKGIIEFDEYEKKRMGVLAHLEQKIAERNEEEEKKLKEENPELYAAIDFFEKLFNKDKFK